MHPWLVPCFAFLLRTITARESGDYHSQYSQSTFTFSGTVPDCQLTSSYSSGGRGGESSHDGCDYEQRVITSYQALDLQLSELYEVCPALEWVPVEYRGIPDSTKRNLPDELVWPRWCTKDSSSQCPRWRCDNSSSLWDRDYNKSYSYHEMTTLSFDSIPVSSQCYQCECTEFSNSYLEQQGEGKQFAWYCHGSGSTRWPSSFNPVWYGEEYTRRQCDKETDSPTPEPTSSPVPEPTPQPTPEPTIAECSDSWGGVHYYTDYYWDTATANDCGTVSWCYCEADGTGTCLNGWEDIMNDDVLYPGFVKNCAYYLADCWKPSEVGRLFEWYDTAADCYLQDSTLCPRCGCTTDPFTQTSVTNTTFLTTLFSKVENDSAVVAKEDYVYEYICSNCTCVYSPEDAINTPKGPVSWVDYSECVSYDTVNNDDEDPQGDCLLEDLKCFSLSGEYIPGAGTATCNDDREGLTEFGNSCAFSRFRLDDSSPDSVCVEAGKEDIYGVWGCSSSYQCELYGGDGCYKASYNYEVAELDCLYDDWIVDTYSGDTIYSCCSDAHYCNNRTIEEHLDDSCSKSSYLSSYEKYSRSCDYSQRNLYDITSDHKLIRAAFCSDRLDIEDYTISEEEGLDEASLCSLLKVYWQYDTFCDCNLARIQIAAIKEEDIKDANLIGKMLRNEFWSASGRRTDQWYLMMMYDYWNCSDHDGSAEDDDTFFTCDFNANVASINNEDASSRWNVLCSVLCVLGIGYLFGDNRTSYTLLLCIVAMVWSVNGRGDLDWSLNTANDADHVGDCEFEGSVTSGSSYVCEQITFKEYEYQEEGVPWSVLVEACPELEQAGCYTEDEQINQKDLIWSKNDCDECPRCPCLNTTDTQRHFTKDFYNHATLGYMMYTYCYLCTCAYWGEAEEWAFDCGWSNWQYGEDYFNGSIEFCPVYPAPTPAPTPAMSLSCVYGSDGDDGWTYSMNGESGYSHCAWVNMTIDRYKDGEPGVCAYDSILNTFSSDYDPYFPSRNSDDPVCLAIAGDNTGCYYADFDLSLATYDCALDGWVKDTYRVDATLWCCNDGYYCNNQSIVHGSASPVPSVEYVNYDNETVSVACKSSSKLREWIEATYGCEYTQWGDDEDYYVLRQCEGGISTSKPGCSTLQTWWGYETHCDCEKAQFYLANVNSTYATYLNEKFDDDWETEREQLQDWNTTFECGWSPNSKWYCSIAQTHKVSMIAIAIVLVFIAN